MINKIRHRKLLGYGCPECHNTEIITDFIRDEKICKQCGLVLVSPPSPLNFKSQVGLVAIYINCSKL